MKKLFALVLAVAMVLSMASVAMAANTAVDGNDANGTWGGLGTAMYIEYVGGDDDGDINETADMTGKEIAYGKTVYIPLLSGEKNQNDAYVQFTKADDVDALKVSAKWDKKGEYVESVEIVKKNSAYWVAIKTTGSSMSENDVEGTITLSGKAYENSGDEKKTNVNTITGDKDLNKFDVVITLKYNEQGADKKEDLGENYNVITETAQVFRFDKDAMQIGRAHV